MKEIIFNIFQVKHEAKLAMTMLEDKSIDSFDKLFIKTVPFTITFDHIVQ